MLDPLPAHDPCPRCGNGFVDPPLTFQMSEWLQCEACREPMVTWSVYKDTAMKRAVELLREKSRTKFVANLWPE
jgi:hypothetical protein